MLSTIVLRLLIFEKKFFENAVSRFPTPRDVKKPQRAPSHWKESHLLLIVLRKYNSMLHTSLVTNCTIVYETMVTTTVWKRKKSIFITIDCHKKVCVNNTYKIFTVMCIIKIFF